MSGRDFLEPGPTEEQLARLKEAAERIRAKEPTPKSTEKRNRLAAEYDKENGAWYLDGRSDEVCKRAFIAGFDAAQKEAQGRIEELEGVLNLKEDEYVRQVGTWKIIQRLEEERDKLELTVKRLEGAVSLGISEMERVQKEILQVRKTYPGIMTPTMNEYSIAPLREALSREGKGET